MLNFRVIEDMKARYTQSPSDGLNGRAYDPLGFLPQSIHSFFTWRQVGIDQAVQDGFMRRGLMRLVVTIHNVDDLRFDFLSNG